MSENINPTTCANVDLSLKKLEEKGIVRISTTDENGNTIEQAIDFKVYNKLPTKRKKVAIVGFAKSWVDTPFADDSFEIWGINELYRYLKEFKGKNGEHARADRWFEIHNPESPSKNNKDHHAWLASCGIPLYMWQHYDKFPSSMPYPKDEVKAMINSNMIFPGNSLDCAQSDKGAKFSNFSNQITWMLLLAVYEGFEEIHVYGVDMATKETIKTPDGTVTTTGEYIFQRPSCEAIIGFALGKGIKVLIPQTSELCKFPQDYGFETDNQVRCFIKSRKQQLQETSNKFAMQEQQLMQQLEQIKQKRLSIAGSINEISYQLGNHII